MFLKNLQILLIIILVFLTGLSQSYGQSVDEDQLGAWYMYFVAKKFTNSQFGLQGDFQLRTWNGGNDLEQLLLRSGATYRPKNANTLLTLGYANITSGSPGESKETTRENRIYQEILLPHKLGEKVLITHRFRYEQRFVEGQDFRTRYRYNLFLNVPFNATELKKKAVYLALYNELFINGQLNIGSNRQVQYFDRNRLYLGIGYGITNNLRTQLGWMKQTTQNWSKGQLQISLHHSY